MTTGNKIIPDESRAGNENRAHVGRAGIYNQMTPMPADGGPVGPVSPGEMGPGILGAPLNSDPHRHGRHSNNLANPPGEKPGSHYAAENRRRIHDPSSIKYR